MDSEENQSTEQASIEEGKEDNDKQELLQKRIDSTAQKLVDTVLERSRIPRIPSKYEYLLQVSDCTTYLPSQCSMMLHPPAKDSVAELFKFRRQADPIPTIEEALPVSYYFTDSEDDSYLEPCSVPIVDTFAHNFAKLLTEETANNIVRDFVSKWNLPKEWKYSIRFSDRTESDDNLLYRYLVCYSKPTLIDPVPDTTVRLYLMLSVLKENSEDLYTISYKMEGDSTIRTERLMPSMLENVIEAKMAMRQSVDSLLPSKHQIESIEDLQTESLPTEN